MGLVLSLPFLVSFRLISSSFPPAPLVVTPYARASRGAEWSEDDERNDWSGERHERKRPDIITLYTSFVSLTISS